MKIKQAKRAEIPFFISLAEKEGWNPGLDDADTYYSADPDGFFIGEFEGEKIGCISAVTYGPNYGFLGLFIVKAPYRSRGFGSRLWKHAFAYLDDRSMGLDAVLAQEKRYKKAGFQTFCKNVRYERKEPFSSASSTRDLKQFPFEVLTKYDLPIFGAPRDAFLLPWIQSTHAHSLGYFKGNQLLGYGVIRKCVRGYKIGPLFADNKDIALQIYQDLSAKAEKGPIYLDVPHGNPAAVELAKELQLQPVFETVRMFRLSPPGQDFEKVFGITSFEVG